MRFVNPEWLWAVALCPLLYVYLRREIQTRKKRFSQFVLPALWGRIAPELDWNARLRKGRIWLTALALLFVAAARPQLGVHEETVTVSGLDILIALDVSNSMEVEDVVPSRLKKAKHLVRSLIDGLRGDRVGLVAFAASSYVACPLTTDLDYVLEQVEILGPRMITNQGTDLGIALETAAKAMDRGAEEGSDPSTSQASKAVILISDGEDQEDQALEGARRLKDAGVRLYVFGVGTEKGGPIPTRDENGNLHGYKRDRGGQSVVSTFKPGALQEIANAAGGKYWTVTAGEGERDELLEDLGALSRSDYTEKKVTTHIDRYQWPLALAILLLFFELGIPARKMGLVAVLVFVFGSEAHAAGNQASLQTWLENRQGLEAFKDGQGDEAKKHFGTAQALDPTRPELQFNQGVVQAQEGDADNAAQGFSSAAQGAIADGKSDLAAQSLFNLGGVLAKKQDTAGAVQSYLSAIDQARLSGNSELEADARKNIELLIKQKKEQKQQQKQDQQKENQKENQDKKDQQQDQKKDGGQSEQQKKQAQNYQDPSKGRKREFKSVKLSKEDADRVMAELSSRERELQGKLKKQKGNPVDNPKDW